MCTRGKHKAFHSPHLDNRISPVSHSYILLKEYWTYPFLILYFNRKMWGSDGIEAKFLLFLGCTWHILLRVLNCSCVGIYSFTCTVVFTHIVVMAESVQAKGMGERIKARGGRSIPIHHGAGHSFISVL